MDKKKIEFVIHNLLTNAFTHTHYAGTVSLSVCEVVNDNMHYVCLIVEDDGKERVRTVEQLIARMKDRNVICRLRKWDSPSCNR